MRRALLYPLVVLLSALLAAFQAQAQTVACDPIGGRVLVGPGAGSLTHSIDWANACASEAAILQADSGFLWQNCSVSGTVMTGDVRDAYGALIFAGRQWERLPIGCTAAPAEPEVPASSASSALTTEEGLTAVEALDAIAWGLLVGLLFVGYRQGYSV